MKNNLKSIIAVAAMGAVSLGLISSSFASTIPVPLQSANSSSKLVVLQPMSQKLLTLQKMQQKPVRLIETIRIIPVRHHFRAWNLGLKRNKHLSQNDAKTIVKAALLMQNRHDLKVGKITNQKNFKDLTVYKIQILNRNNQVISAVKLNSATGFVRPVRLIRN